MTEHPAYPSRETVIRHSAAVRLAERERDNNARISSILHAALDRLAQCDLDGYSMVPGYDLTDIYDAIVEMLPVLSDDAGHMLDDWAADQINTGSVS